MGDGGDIDLLRLEMDTLWGCDHYGRPPRPHPLVALAIADDGWDVRFGTTVPSEMRRSLMEDTLPIGEDKRRAGPLAFLEGWREGLMPLGPIRDEGGPSYVFPREALPLSVPTTLRLFTSEDRAEAALKEARPDPWWEPQEWSDLVAGRLGPWAIGMVGERVVTLCHTPVASSTAAEAGVWTRPDERGRGWAGIVTAAWARVAAPRFETLFYSTAFDNAASQAVARKRGLRPIGTIGQFHVENPPQGQT